MKAPTFVCQPAVADAGADPYGVSDACRSGGQGPSRRPRHRLVLLYVREEHPDERPPDKQDPAKRSCESDERADCPDTAGRSGMRSWRLPSRAPFGPRMGLLGHTGPARLATTLWACRSGLPSSWRPEIGSPDRPGGISETVLPADITADPPEPARYRYGGTGTTSLVKLGEHRSNRRALAAP